MRQFISIFAPAVLVAIVGFAVMLVSPDLAAQVQTENPDEPDRIERLEARIRQLEEQAAKPETESKLSWSGYGVMAYEQRDYYRNTQDNEPDSRRTTDAERVILAPRYVFDERWEFLWKLNWSTVAKPKHQKTGLLE
jgi:hypothetical protein